jgi:hypothetical protein
LLPFCRYLWGVGEQVEPTFTPCHNKGMNKGMNKTYFRLDHTKAEKEAWRMLRGHADMNIGYLKELVDVYPTQYLPRVDLPDNFFAPFLLCQDCGHLLAVEPCVTCLGIGLDDCSECFGWGGSAYCPVCDAGEDGDDDGRERVDK